MSVWCQKWGTPRALTRISCGVWPRRKPSDERVVPTHVSWLGQFKSYTGLGTSSQGDGGEDKRTPGIRLELVQVLCSLAPVVHFKAVAID